MNDHTDPRPTGQDERLARLAARSAAARAATPGAPFPPPSPQDRAGRPARATRRHPAKGSRSAALTLSVMTTLGLTGFFKVQAEDTTATAAATISGSSATASTTATTATTATTETTATTATADTTAATDTATAAATQDTTAAATTSTTDLADGTYVGETDTNKWGPVQVQIVVSGGTITEVDVLQYPDENDKDVAINNRALPTLIQETLTAQSADVDSVSGATYTSDSYKVSLQSAIDQARAAASAS